MVGKDAVKNFAGWLLEKVALQQQEGGALEIDAFSHCATMGAFILALEDKLKINIISSKRLPENRYDNEKLLGHYSGDFRLLKNINFFTTSKEASIINLIYETKVYKIPLSIIKELSENYEPQN